MPGFVSVVVKMPVEEYLKGDSGPCQTIEALAVKFGGRWVGSGTDMTAGISDVQYVVPAANVAGLVEALKSAGLPWMAAR